MVGISKTLLRALLLWVLCLYTAQTVADVLVKGVRVWRAPERTRVVFDLSEAVQYNTLRLGNPERLVIDLKNTRLHASLATVDLKNSPVQRMRSGVRNGNDLRIVLDLNSAVKPNSFSLTANERYGDRLVIDLLDLDRGPPQPIVVSKPALDDKRDIIVAIDAGHGGEDPGAIGARRIREKDVVYAIATALARLLEKEPGFKPVMIREGDYFMALRERPAKAREANADLMLSIHADAFRLKSAHGASVYTLSERGSSSTFAAELAERENRADRIGGAGETYEDVNRVLVDLALTASKEASERASNHLTTRLGKVAPMHKKRPQMANFAVLRSAVPSLLVETGFISNPEEARRLNSPRYQQQLAQALFQGVKSYFEDLPPEGSLLAWQAKQKGKQQTHTIRSGETLSGIAQRYQVSLRAIKALNGLRGDNIRVGQILKIPG